jgi:hypothetical protein
VGSLTALEAAALRAASEAHEGRTDTADRERRLYRRTSWIRYGPCIEIVPGRSQERAMGRLFGLSVHFLLRYGPTFQRSMYSRTRSECSFSGAP